MLADYSRSAFSVRFCARSGSGGGIGRSERSSDVPNSSLFHEKGHMKDCGNVRRRGRLFLADLRDVSLRMNFERLIYSRRACKDDDALDLRSGAMSSEHLAHHSLPRA